MRGISSTTMIMNILIESACSGFSTASFYFLPSFIPAIFLFFAIFQTSASCISLPAILYSAPSCFTHHLVFPTFFIPRYLVFPTIFYIPLPFISRHLLFPASFCSPLFFHHRYIAFHLVFPANFYSPPTFLLPPSFHPRHLVFNIRYKDSIFHLIPVLYMRNSVHHESAEKKFNNERPHCNTWTGKPWINRIQGNRLE